MNEIIDDRRMQLSMQLTVEEQVRIAAVTIMSARVPGATLPQLVDLADALGEYFITGELPQPKPGTSY